jgi:hypothetical protein
MVNLRYFLTGSSLVATAWYWRRNDTTNHRWQVQAMTYQRKVRTAENGTYDVEVRID